MAFPIFNPQLEDGRHAWQGYTYVPMQRVESWKRKGPGHTQSVVMDPLELGGWAWPAGQDEDQRTTWLDFFRAIDWRGAPFLLRAPRDALRGTVTLEPAVGDGAKTVFSLPTGETDEEFRYYPNQDGHLVGIVNGVPGAAVTAQTDARTITFAAPPGIGQSVQATFLGLRLVRLVAPPQIASPYQVFTRYQLELEEVLRDA